MSKYGADFFAKASACLLRKDSNTELIKNSDNVGLLSRINTLEAYLAGCLEYITLRNIPDGLMMGNDFVECGACGEEVYITWDSAYKYCPYCGQKIREVKNG